jgi:hypothetical protein
MRHTLPLASYRRTLVYIAVVVTVSLVVQLGTSTHWFGLA